MSASVADNPIAVPVYLFNDLLEYFEQREDASTDSGDWQGNEEMGLAQRLRAARPA